ncbi:DUF3080 domain-containing protein [Marinobacterium sp. CAU 1594]|nr:DUF3080 domain-containing protein [Marinobacterium arenosum]
MLENYLYRLGNATEQSIDKDLRQLPPTAAYPPRRERLRPELELREGLVDTLRLRHCNNLLGLIAERNSSLGRVMPVSKKLVYELRFFTAIRDCRTELPEDAAAELRQQLDEIYQLKKRNLDNVAWNAFYNAPEMEANFALGEPPLAPADDGGIGPVLDGLKRFEQLARLIHRDDGWQLPAFLEQIERDYQILNNNRFGARWLSGLRLLTETLERGSDALQARLEQRALCPLGRSTPQAKILHRVFIKFYAGEVQPYMALLHRSGQRWLQQQQQLLEQLAHSDLLSAYREAVLSPHSKLWRDYEQARRRHVELWQQQLGQCGLMPSRS